MQNINVKMYTTPDCLYCDAARDYFRKKGVAFKEYDVSKSNEKWTEMIEQSGQLGVPVIFINGRIFIGFDRKEIEQSLALAKNKT